MYYKVIVSIRPSVFQLFEPSLRHGFLRNQIPSNFNFVLKYPSPHNYKYQCLVACPLVRFLPLPSLFCQLNCFLIVKMLCLLDAI